MPHQWWEHLDPGHHLSLLIQEVSALAMTPICTPAMTHALADDVHHAIFLLCQCNENDNIQKRPDICVLRTLVHGAILQSSFSAHSGTAVFLWALREEVYIDAWMAALSAGGSIKDCKDAVMAVPKAPYAHDQSWPATTFNCVLTREHICDWPEQSTTELGHALNRAVSTGDIGDYDRAMTSSSHLKWLGVYGPANLVRAAFTIQTQPVPHPSKQFIDMGGGANYNFFMNRGITNMDELNNICHNCGANFQLDAGNLAYLLCRLKSCQVTGWELLHEVQWSSQRKKLWTVHHQYSLTGNATHETDKLI